MLELTRWFRESGFPAKPWLVLGKGPTFDRRTEFDLSAYNSIALNHVVNELHVDVAHAIDIDVVEDCAERIEHNCDWLLMPRYPHVRSTSGDRPLEDYFDDLPVLRRISDGGRLVWYNLAHTPQVGDSPVIGATRFSSEAVLNVLGRMGVETVRSLGVDGGRSYAPSFAALEETTLLTNGALDFHLQFELLEVIAAEHGLDFRPLVEPLRIFVDADESELVPYRVLEYALRRGSTVPVEVTARFELPDGGSRGMGPEAWLAAIPALCDHRGQALVLEADVLVLGDVAELARRPVGAGAARPSTHPPVARLVDCERAGCAPEPLEPGDLDVLRFPERAHQPWRGDDHPLAELWMEVYREAVLAGGVPPEEVDAAIAAGTVRPALQAALRLAPSRRSPFTNAARDFNEAQRRALALERELEAMRSSSSWRLGSAIVRTLRAPAKIWGKVWAAPRPTSGNR